ncbi:MAG: hypothetical protein PHQ96_02200 [Candidatus Omnitrophica bacterium]|nr:hypothetical protein [Candidatus Omnitrophota bacterium]
MGSLGKYKNLIITIVVIALFAWVMKGLYADYISKKAVLEEKRAQIAKEKELIVRWGAATDAYNKAAQKFFQKDPAIFKRFVEDSAQNNNIVISSLSTSRSDEGIFVNVRLNLKARSSYRGLLKFVKELESKNVSIERISIHKAQGSSIDEDIVVKAYVLKE